MLPFAEMFNRGSSISLPRYPIFFFFFFTRLTDNRQKFEIYSFNPLLKKKNFILEKDIDFHKFISISKIHSNLYFGSYLNN